MLGSIPPKDGEREPTVVPTDHVADQDPSATPAGGFAHGSEEHDYDALLLEYLRDSRADADHAVGLARVLLVDPIETRRQALHEMLVAAGYDVTDARSGEAAFHAVADASFDLVLADNALPDVSGDDLRVAVQKARAGVSVLVMTDDRRVVEGGAVTDLGARGYVEKPLRGLVLLSAIERALASRVR